MNIKQFCLGTASVLAFATPVGFTQEEVENTPQAVEEEAAVLNTIVVTGIRQSLELAAERKRAASGLSDVIAAEDLGKFPDQNIAESLQRVPGVTIDRNGGEGQFVSVRGFGPSFNTVLVNGRRLASETGNREFSFDLFPSELISGADVFKSSVANLQEGGIGSTINLRTARPLDFDGQRVVVSARALQDDNSGETSPQFFGLYSNTFADDTIGFLLSASFQERESVVRTYNNRGWNSVNLADLDPSVNVTNPAGVDRIFVAQNLQLGETEQSRERTNIQAVAQFQPSSDVVVTLDGMYNDFDLTSESKFLNNWFSPGDITSFDLDQNGTAVRFDHNANGAVEARAQNDGRPTNTYFAGFNTTWHASDSFSHSIDAVFSHSENQPTGADTGQAVLGFRSAYSYIHDGTEVPIARWAVPGTDALNADNYLFHIAQFGGDGDSKERANVVDTDLWEIKYDGTYSPEADGIKEIRYGLSYGSEEKDVQILRTPQNVLCMYCGFFVDVPSGFQDQLLVPFTNSFISQGQGGFQGSDGTIVQNFLTNTVAGDIAAQSDPAVLAARDAALGVPVGTSEAELLSKGGFGLQPRPEGYGIEENIFAAYVDATLQGEIGSVPWELYSGVRWIRTETTSAGTVTALSDIRVNAFDTTEYLQELEGDGGALVNTTNEYNFLLPSLSLKADLTDNLVWRVAASQTVTRPQLTDLSPRLAVLQTRPNLLIALGGNPNLDPYSSTNFDMSFEYYLNDITYLAVSGFWKEVDNFITQSLGREDFTILNQDGIVDPRIDGTTATFDVTRPQNTETATVEGIELSGQVGFEFLPGVLDGLGASANLLFVSSDAEVSQNTQDRVVFGLPGLSNSRNFQLFYSKGGLDARIAYSWRDSFIEQLSNVIGGEPVFVDEFEQVDFKVSYDLPVSSAGSYQVFLEGTNILDEDIRKLGRFDNHFLELTNTGPRYAVGVRATF